MIEEADTLGTIGASVILVAYDEISLLEKKMMHGLASPFPLVRDPAKELYRAWGMGRTNLFGAMLSPGLNWRYLKLLLKGERFLGIAPDMFQLGGDFVVDPRGRIAFAHTMQNNGDRASVPTLIQETRRAAALK